MIELSTLTALSPLDGRYAEKAHALRPYFSEYGLMRYRILVELRWLKKLASLPNLNELTALTPATDIFLEQIFINFTQEEALLVKDIESVTNHDVKAIEYYIKQKCEQHAALNNLKEFIHFACTSEDINNLAYGLMLKEARTNVIEPIMLDILNQLKARALLYADLPMLSRTHGQPASPTTVGKELANFKERLKRQYFLLKQTPIRGKINGAVGNFNAHMATYGEINWSIVAEQFVTDLGLTWNPYTTQIEPHDYIAEMLSCINRFNSILIDLCRDIWGYISLGYFFQKPVDGEIGSSTMPHKINPIDFENAEGNLSLANALFGFFSNQLLTSRWQRDLVDSTLLRNLGCGFAHSLIAYQSFLKGLNKIEVNTEKLENDLNDNWEVLAEPIQTVMRRYGVEQPYEKLKMLTRGKKVTASDLSQFIDTLALPPDVKVKLKLLTPNNYVGNAAAMAKKAASD